MSTSNQAFGNAPEQMAVRAAEILRENDLGGWTKAAPRLYPHQWSWDSAFIAIGLAHLDTRRAAQELRMLFAAQWTTGMVPHIVFNPAASGYFPNLARWATEGLPTKPAGMQTSGMCQPPVHAIAAQFIGETARGTEAEGDADHFLHELYPRLLAWHRYLATDRDPEQSGLVTLYHPWEGGADNSPAWDAPMAAITVGDLPPYERHDFKHADPSMRPTMAEYDRYLWIVEVMKQGHYDEATTYRTNPFLVKGVWFSAIFVAANDALLEIAAIVGAPDADRAAITGWRDRGLRGLDERWDPHFGLALDYDLRAAAPIPVRVMGGFAPLIAGHLTPGRRAAILQTYDSPAWLGHPQLRWPMPLSTSPEGPGFDPRRYWRGPTWPVMNWLFWWALMQASETERAANLRQASLRWNMPTVSPAMCGVRKTLSSARSGSSSGSGSTS
ncbi:MAG: glycogen debranching protein [Thermomicrobia bacterium]|nr:glycogen debranching protein [Thermomicrobia bacterium]